VGRDVKRHARKGGAGQWWSHRPAPGRLAELKKISFIPKKSNVFYSLNMFCIMKIA
jgi:hypothetical protein